MDVEKRIEELVRQGKIFTEIFSILQKEKYNISLKEAKVLFLKYVK
jgi:hypothetical protein